MKWSETRQSAANNNEAKSMYAVDAISPERATDYAKKLFEMRVRGWGDENDALEDVSARVGISERSFKRLMKGETKDPGLRLFARVRAAYLDYCHSMIKRLQDEIAIEKEIHGHAAFEDIGADVEVLVRKVEAAKKIQATGKGKR
ncbi:MAG: hypothetical protein JWQ74_3540 [Marmoricola sp.]|nr:hypothetical protein [Marmoricola sp.]